MLAPGLDIQYPRGGVGESVALGCILNIVISDPTKLFRY